MKDSIAAISNLLKEVYDPEIPVLSITDLGVVRGIEAVNGHFVIRITPTYSGCPAMDTIASDIINTLQAQGYQVRVEQVLSPAWTTDWITVDGRRKLEAYGIAAPLEEHADKRALLGEARVVRCTHCGSQNTRLLSPFGSTACKALFQCAECLEPFDYFKCLK